MAAKSLKKVLIAEDEDAIRLALGQALTNEGIQTFLAPDGQTALDLALKEHPDLIILDMVMPKLHGMDVYNNIRNDIWGSQVRIIFLTNFGQNPRTEEAAQHEQTELIVKNDSKLSEIVRIVKNRLGI